MTKHPQNLFDPVRETLDAALKGRVKLIQPKSGYRFSVDALLLAYFAPYARRGTVLELGCGCGVVSLLLLHQGKIRRAAGVEIQEELAELSRRNAALNDFSEQFQVIHDDYRRMKDRIPPQSCSLLLSNPPFFPPGEGRDNPDPQISTARREHNGGMKDLMETARYLLSGSGKLVLVYPSERLSDLFSESAAHGLSVKRLRFVHPRPGRKARLVLVEVMARTGVRPEISAPFYLETETGADSPEAARLYKGDWDPDGEQYPFG